MKNRLMGIVLVYLVLLYVIHYYNTFYIYAPVRPFDKENTFFGYTLYNYFFRALYNLLKVFVLTGIFSAVMKALAIKLTHIKKPVAVLFEVFITTEFVYLIYVIVEIYYFKFINVNYTLEDLQYFNISLVSFLDMKDSLLSELALEFGLFDIIYMFLMFYEIRHQLELNSEDSGKLVLFAYIVPMVFLTFSLYYIGF